MTDPRLSEFYATTRSSSTRTTWPDEPVPVIITADGGEYLGMVMAWWDQSVWVDWYTGVGQHHRQTLPAWSCRRLSDEEQAALDVRGTADQVGVTHWLARGDYGPPTPRGH